MTTTAAGTPASGDISRRTLVSTDNIPEELKRLKQWVLWKYEEREGKPTKVPYSPTGYNATVKLRSTWSTFDEVHATYKNNECYAGIGFVFSETDPYVGVDIDDLSDDDLEFVRSIGSYAEISPSGHGIHIFVKGTINGDRRRNGKYEIYMEWRYFTVTGNHIKGAPVTINEDQAAIDALYQKIFPQSTISSPSQTNMVKADGLCERGEKIIARCSAAKNGPKFYKLFNGDISGYPSRSEADLALCGIIAYNTTEVQVIDWVFRQSRLYREKWDELHGNYTYGQKTIQNALKPLPPKRQSTNQVNAIIQQDKKDTLHLTDIGNAERLVAQQGDNIRYCHARKCWYVWNGYLWERDETGAMIRLATDVVKGIYGEAETEDDVFSRKLIANWAKASESIKRRKDLLESAQSLVPVRPTELDNDANLLNCLNGTIELDTTSFREHRRGDLLTRRANVEYNPDATSPTWEAHLDLIFKGDQTFIARFQEMCGYTLLHENPEQAFFICHGSGKNGKSVTLDVLSDILGNYSKNIGPESLMIRRNESPRSDIARLGGARLITASEVEDNARLAESLIKQLTGGDKITARRLYENEEEVRITGKIWLATNHKPRIRGTDNAIWRRIWLIPFDVTIPDDQCDPLIKEKLLAERAGILNWCLAGLRRYYANGNKLIPPTRVVEATRGYREDSDTLSEFILDQCLTGDNHECNRGDFFNAYREWCDRNGEMSVSRKKLAELLQERGIKEGSVQNGNRSWRGIKINSHM